MLDLATLVQGRVPGGPPVAITQRNETSAGRGRRPSSASAARVVIRVSGTRALALGTGLPASGRRRRGGPGRTGGTAGGSGSRAARGSCARGETAGDPRLQASDAIPAPGVVRQAIRARRGGRDCRGAGLAG